MKFWIEVTSGIRFERLLREGVKLEAPHTTRFINFFKELREGDVVLHYMTATLTRKEWRSSIIASSRIGKNPEVNGKKIVAPCSNTVMIEPPIKLLQIKKLPEKSDRLDRVLSYSMQKYLIEIDYQDFKNIMAFGGNEKIKHR